MKHHQWIEGAKVGFPELGVVCKNCGIVINRNNVDKFCKGKVKVGPRTQG